MQTREPGVIFLAEAFTRPKVMRGLAKLGFTQSYTYFTWRTTKHELMSYLTELTRLSCVANTSVRIFSSTRPDINPFHLQGGERWMFQSRVALAATLAGNYGIYNGFELLEHEPIPGKEEYLQLGEIRDQDARLEHAGKHQATISAGSITSGAKTRRCCKLSNLRFVAVDDADVIGYVKESVDHANAVAVAIALTGQGPRQFWLHFGDLQIGPPHARRPVKWIENLVTGARHGVEWGGVRLWIDQSQDPALIFRCHTRLIGNGS